MTRERSSDRERLELALQVAGLGEFEWCILDGTMMVSARMAANAARAVTLGLGSMRAPEPPPFYAFDRDTRRLAVSTPRYSTAVIPDNR